MNSDPPQRDIKSSIFLTLIVILTLIVYGQVRHFSFIEYDDGLYVTENPVVQKGLTIEGMRWAFTSTHAGNWHPLTWLSHMLDCELFDLNPMGHHWVNLMFHIVNTLLLFIFLQKSTGAKINSAFVAALFALHPLHVESVAWVAERKDVLSTFFFFITLIVYLWYTKRPCVGRYLLVFLGLSLGLMAKPMLVTLPFLLLLLDFWPLNRVKIADFAINKSGERLSDEYALRKLVIEKLPFFILVAIFGIIVFRAQEAAHAIYSLENLPVGVRLTNAVMAYVGYLFKLVWPFNLAVFYPHPLRIVPFKWIAVASIILILLSVFVARNIRSKTFLFTGWCWYLGTLVPVIGLVQVGAQSMADRYTYIPVVGIFIMVVWGIDRLVNKKKIPRIISLSVGCLILICFSLLSRQQVSTWKNGLTVFQHALDVTENNWLAHNNLGRALQGRGKIDAAIKQYKSALVVAPKYDQASFNIADALHQTGKIDAAVNWYKKTLQIKPTHTGAHNNLGTILYQQGRIAEAEKHYRKILEIDPKNPSAHNHLGNLFFNQKAWSNAVHHYRTALLSDPESVNAHLMLGYLMRSSGNEDEAIRHFAEVIKLTPDNKEAYFLIGDIFFRQGKHEFARRFTQKALQIDPLYENALNLLSSINGKVQEAPVNNQKAP